MPLWTIKLWTYHQNSSSLLFVTVHCKTQNLPENLENIQKHRAGIQSPFYKKKYSGSIPSLLSGCASDVLTSKIKNLTHFNIFIHSFLLNCHDSSLSSVGKLLHSSWDLQCQMWSGVSQKDQKQKPKTKLKNKITKLFFSTWHVFCLWLESIQH